ncbi:histidine kinase N-terminal 7TM domain-containing protein [Haloferax namakaokahaiae]|uniref:histidine kinase n=1 Tax=Haloferax namakaokahaiae TaxID=1748331 RepID=A0ABD5ZI77_9EURY
MLVGGVVSPLVVLCLVAATVSCSIGIVAWREGTEPGSKSLAVLLFAATLWAGSYALALTVFDPQQRVLFQIPIDIAQAIIAPAWFSFTLAYTGRGELLSRELYAIILSFPALTLVVLVTSPELLWSNYHIVRVFGAATAKFDPNFWYYLHAVYGYVIIGTGLLLVAEMLVERFSHYRAQATALAIGSTAPTIAHVTHTFGIGPFPTVNFTPVALALTGATFGYALYRFELFGLSPATGRLGRRAAIDDVAVGIFVLDREERVIETNEAARSLLDLDAGSVSLQPLTAVLPGIDLGEERQLTEVTVNRRTRTYEVTVSPVTDQHGRRLGRTVSVSDATERVHRRQRLEVLNRVLRHNLRNDMTVVIGYTDIVEGKLPKGDRDSVETIRARSNALLSLAEKARSAERVMANIEHSGTFDAASVIRQTAESVAAAFETDLTVLGPDSLTISGSESVTRLVVRELVENALEHGGDSPVVQVEFAASDGVLVVHVADDGPGVPAYERNVVEAGGESPLEHGSGIGLWAVRWTVDALGGILEFDIDDGTTATVKLPYWTDREAAEDGAPTEST